MAAIDQKVAEIIDRRGAADSDDEDALISSASSVCNNCTKK